MKNKKVRVFTLIMALVLSVTCLSMCLTACGDNRVALKDIALGEFVGETMLGEKNPDLKEVYTKRWKEGQNNKSYNQTSGKWSIGSAWLYNSGCSYNGDFVFEKAKFSDGNYESGTLEFVDGQSAYVSKSERRAVFVWEAEEYGVVKFNGLFAKSNTAVATLAKTQYGLNDNLYTGNIDVDSENYNFYKGDSYTIDMWKVASYGAVTEYLPLKKTFTSEFVYLVDNREFTAYAGDKFIFSITCNESGEDDKAVLTLLDATFTAKVNQTELDKATIMQSRKIGSFFAISDTHINGVEDKYFPQLIADMTSIDKDAFAILNAGDLSERGVSEHYGDQIADYYTSISKQGNYLINSLGNAVPYYNVMGNHDTRGATDAGAFVDGVTDVWQYWSDNKDTYFNWGIESYKEHETTDGINWFKNNWVRMVNGIQIIGLNYDSITNDWDSNFLTEEDMNWLDQTLTAGEQINSDMIQIVIVHGSDFEGNVKILDSELTFREVMDRHPSAVVISGHTHHAFGSNKFEVGSENSASYVNMPGMNWNWTLSEDTWGEGGITWSQAGNAPTTEYYYIEVYEDGVIFRAREFGGKLWMVESDVAILKPSLR